MELTRYRGMWQLAVQNVFFFLRKKYYPLLTTEGHLYNFVTAPQHQTQVYHHIV